MIRSIMLYTVLLAFCWLCACRAARRDDRKYVWLIILGLTLVSGLRGYSVGLDTQSYVSKFAAIAAGDFQEAYGLEESFKYLCYGFLRIIPSTTALLTALALITNWCVITRFWELRKIASFSCMVLCYYTAFYFMTMNGIRQFCAVGIVFYFTRYLSQKKLLPFLLGVAIATLLHRSAVIGLALLAVNCLRWKGLSKGQKVFYFISVLLLPAVLAAGMQVLNRYAKYFSTVSLDLGWMILLKLLFLAVSLCYVFGIHAGDGYFRQGKLSDGSRFDIGMACLCDAAALLLAALGYVFPRMERISWYFYLFEGVYFGMLLKGRKTVDRLIFGYFIALLMGYGFVRSMLHNSQGTMPYLFFWE